MLAVLLHHWLPELLPGGYLGVDLFFVLSGYVVARAQAGRAFEPARFYGRRLQRLQPALVMVVLTTGLLAAGCGLLSPTGLATAITSLIGAANLALLQQSQDYFGAAAALNPFLHTWSLGVEEQFYLLFPWLFAGLRDQRRWAQTAGSLLLIGSAALWWQLQSSQPEAGFFLMPARLWELGLGTALQLVELHGRALGGIQQGWLGTGLLALCFGLPTNQLAIATPLAVAASLLLIAEHPQRGGLHRLLRRPMLQAIGQRSYGLYLWHWPLLVILRQLLPWPVWLSSALALAASFVLAWASFRWLEQPLRRSPWRATAGGTIRLGLAGSATAAVVLSGSWWQLPANRDTPAQALAQRENRLLKQACHSPRSTDPLPRCLPAASDARPRLLLLGDSHAAQLRPLLEQWIDQQAAADRPILLQWSDRALPNQWLGRSGCREPAYCYSNPALLKAVDQALPPGSLVIWSLYSGRLNGNERTAAETQAAASSLSHHLKILASLLQRSDRQLLLVHAIPRLSCPENTPFAAAFNRGGHGRVDALCSLPEHKALQERRPLDQVYRSVLRQHRNVVLVDGHPRFCAEGRCRLSNDLGHMLVWDELSHLTRQGLQRLEPLISPALTHWQHSQLHRHQGH